MRIILKVNMPESQAHGKINENNIRKEVFGLEPGENHISEYDINSDENTITHNNGSIKTTGGNTVYCSDIERFIKSDGVMIVSQYEQTAENTKTIKKTYLFWLNDKHSDEINKLNINAISEYVKKVKSLPRGKIQPDQRFYKEEKKCLETDYFKIHPKVDSKNQRRVQCSLNIETMKKILDYQEWDGAKIQLNEKMYTYTDTIASTPRIRH
jgi:hypothetical protein